MWGAPLCLCWLILIDIRGNDGRRKVKDMGKVGSMRRSGKSYEELLKLPGS